jgi:hypothetical protein
MNWHVDEDVTRRKTNHQLNLDDENWRGADRLGLEDLAKRASIDTLEVRYIGLFEPLHVRLCFSDLKLVALRHLSFEQSMRRWSGICGLLAEVSQPIDPRVTHSMLDYHEIGQTTVLHPCLNHQLVKRRE